MLDIDGIRAQFPALSLTDDGRRRIYLDNPAGTQVPVRVANAMRHCLLETNANLGGYFATSRAADDAVQSARDAVADLLNAPSSDEIIFGQNMTTLVLHLSRSIGQRLSPGDEIIVTRMDHDANVWPWVLLAEDLDLKIRWLEFDVSSFEFDLAELDSLLGARTKLVCVGGASNLTGTINDVAAICERARAAGAWSFVDAVQSVPHIATDVQAIGCDFLACSSYKFFGPHQGIVWGRRECLESLQPYKVRPASASIPGCFETGTQSHEGIVGCGAAVDYLADIGATMGGDYLSRWPSMEGRRQQLHAAMDLLFDYEKSLAERLIRGLLEIDGVRVLGITDYSAFDRRVPTVSIVPGTRHPDSVAEKLADAGIFVWSGHNYAVEIARAVGILDSGGAIRIGPVHYNTADEIDETLAALRGVMR